jgi:hypothetical protein
MTAAEKCLSQNCPFHSLNGFPIRKNAISFQNDKVLSCHHGNTSSGILTALILETTGGSLDQIEQRVMGFTHEGTLLEKEGVFDT